MKTTIGGVPPKSPRLPSGRWKEIDIVLQNLPLTIKLTKDDRGGRVRWARAGELQSEWVQFDFEPDEINVNQMTQLVSHIAGLNFAWNGETIHLGGFDTKREKKVDGSFVLWVRKYLPAMSVEEILRKRGKQ